MTKSCVESEAEKGESTRQHVLSLAPPLPPRATEPTADRSPNLNTASCLPFDPSPSPDSLPIGSSADLESVFASPPIDDHTEGYRVNQMQSNTRDPSVEYKTENSKSPKYSKKKEKRLLEIFDSGIEHGVDQSSGSCSNQLVIYNSATSDLGQDALVVTDLTKDQSQTSFFERLLASKLPRRVSPSIGAFTVQCATCFKWRLIPTKEKYEEIRENILQEPFVCERAREWRPDILCEDPEDISPDGSRVWAIDKPNIAQPPPGWERLVRIRGEGSTKFADVYYATPSGKKLRSMVEIERYLFEHPEYSQQGVNISQFSFQIPRPLQENYVRKCTVQRSVSSCHNESLPLPLQEVKPLSWGAPPSQKDLQIGEPDDLAPYLVDPVQLPPYELTKSPAKKMKTRRPMPKQMPSSPVYDQPHDKSEDAK
ncbi:methyl-CpG-binding domain-containing protein 2-like [Canna indica]|uniref:Methyl-CpG-binding domain-containing protein 2-like n=1 Tax=Canna indica TaxID=4628 RepID=A0AAQ3JWI2_9LILI|nr:methyl-CpG-binding domain-containing protein 2-like [Canna indica]